MSFVFVSHANPDKKKIRHIVNALIESGEKIWLDNPAAMGFTVEQINAHFHRIRAGGRWRDEIQDALKAAGAVLVCWSERAKEDRKVWQSEATIARYDGKLVCCRIDEVASADLPDDFRAEQIVDVRPDLPGAARSWFWGKPIRVPRDPAEFEPALRLLIQDVRALRSRHAFSRIEKPSHRDLFIPYLVNRTDHEAPIGSAIEEVTLTGGVRPFVIVGPENECPDAFLERLRRHTSLQRLRRGTWYEIKVEWPLKRAPADFPTDFSRRLASELRLPERAEPTVIAKAMADRDRPVAVVSMIRAEEWELAEPKRVKAWLEWWRSLASDVHRISAVPILAVVMGKAKPGWRTCPSGTSEGASVPNEQIWREIETLQRAHKRLSVARLPSPTALNGPTVLAPPILHPVSKGDASRWMGHHFGDTTPEKLNAKTIIDQLFSSKHAATHGVALEDFADALRPMFGTAG